MKKIIKNSVLLSSVLFVQNSFANEEINLSDIDNSNYDKINVEGKKEFNFKSDIIKTQNIPSKEESKINVEEKNIEKVNTEITNIEQPKISKENVKVEPIKTYKDNIKVKQTIEETKWFEERTTLQTEEISLYEILNDLVPSNIIKNIDIINKETKDIKIFNANFINRPIGEILDYISNKNNVFIDYENNKIDITTIKTKNFQLPVNSGILINTSVELGSGSGSSGSTSGSTSGSSSGGDSAGSTGMGSSSGSSSGSSGGSGVASNLKSTINLTTSDNNTISTDLKEIMTELPNGFKEKVLYDKNTGVINVTAAKRTMNTVENYLNRIISLNKEQVLIETKILRFKSYDKLAYGIKWNKLFENLSHGLTIDAAVNTMKSSAYGLANAIEQTVAGSNGTLNLGITKSDGTNIFITALEQLGTVETLSEPTILLNNNYTSTINAGKIINYIESVTVNQDEMGNKTFSPQTSKIQDGFSMAINAKITEDKEHISLFLSPILNTTLSLNQERNPDTGDLLATTPIVDSRSLSLFTKIKNGDTIVLGGLKETLKDKSDNGVPLLNRIPVIKNLFGYKENSEGKDELIILVKATRITN